MTATTIGNGTTVVDEGLLTGPTLSVGNGADLVTLDPCFTIDTIRLGGGNDTLAADDQAI
jgi:hypothetical protein